MEPGNTPQTENTVDSNRIASGEEEEAGVKTVLAPETVETGGTAEMADTEKTPDAVASEQVAASVEVTAGAPIPHVMEEEEMAEKPEAMEEEEVEVEKPEAIPAEQIPHAMEEEEIEKPEATEVPQAIQPSEAPQSVPSNRELPSPAASPTSPTSPAAASPSALSSEELTRLVHVKDYENQILQAELERVRQLYSTVALAPVLTTQSRQQCSRMDEFQSAFGSIKELSQLVEERSRQFDTIVGLVPRGSPPDLQPPGAADAAAVADRSVPLRERVGRAELPAEVRRVPVAAGAGAVLRGRAAAAADGGLAGGGVTSAGRLAAKRAGRDACKLPDRAANLRRSEPKVRTAGDADGSPAHRVASLVHAHSRHASELQALAARNQALSQQLQAQQSKLAALQDEKLRLLGEMGAVRCVEVPSSAEAAQRQLLQVTREKEELSVYLEHVLRELEDKTPILQARQKAFEALQEDYHALLQRWNARFHAAQPSGEEVGPEKHPSGEGVGPEKQSSGEKPSIGSSQPSGEETVHHTQPSGEGAVSEKQPSDEESSIINSQPSREESTPPKQPSGEASAPDELVDALFAELRRLGLENRHAQERVAATERQRDFYRGLLVARRGDEALKRLLEEEAAAQREEREKLEKQRAALEEREKQLQWELSWNRGIVETRDRERALLRSERSRFEKRCDALEKRIAQLRSRLSEAELKSGVAKLEQVSVLSSVALRARGEA